MPPPEAPIWADLPGSRPGRQGLAVPLRARNRTGPRRAGCPAGATAAWREPGAILAQAILHFHCSTIATSRQSLVQALQGKSVRPGGLKGGRYGVRSATNRVLDYLPCSSQQGGASSRGLLLPDAPPAVHEPGGASVICSVSSFVAAPCLSDPPRHIPCANFRRALPTLVKGRLDVPRHRALARVTGRRVLGDCA